MPEGEQGRALARVGGPTIQVLVRHGAHHQLFAAGADVPSLVPVREHLAGEPENRRCQEGRCASRKFYRGTCDGGCRAGRCGTSSETFLD